MKTIIAKDFYKRNFKLINLKQNLIFAHVNKELPQVYK